MKISFVGCGKVGATIAYTAALQGLADQMVMVDISADKARGEALDILQCQAVCPQTRITSGTMPETAGSDIIVISAGIPRKADEPRTLLLSRNASLIADITRQAVHYSPNCLIFMVTNPLDVMTFLAHQASGLPQNRVIGMGTALDTFRYRSYISAAFHCDARDVDAYVVGEHGETMVPLRSHISVQGVPLADLPGYSSEKLADIGRDVVAASGQVIALKGGTVFAPAATACTILAAIVRDSRRLLPVCTFNPQYGVAVSLPTLIGRDGASQTLLPPMDSTEKELLAKSIDSIRASVKELKI